MRNLQRSMPLFSHCAIMSISWIRTICCCQWIFPDFCISEIHITLLGVGNMSFQICMIQGPCKDSTWGVLSYYLENNITYSTLILESVFQPVFHLFLNPPFLCFLTYFLIFFSIASSKSGQDAGGRDGVGKILDFQCQTGSLPAYLLVIAPLLTITITMNTNVRPGPCWATCLLLLHHC